MFKKKQGFTIMELLVVLSCIILLGAATTVGVSNYLQTGRRAATHASLSAVTLAVNRYNYLHKKLPAQLSDLTKNDAGENGALLRAEDLRDIWNNTFNYAQMTTTRTYAVWSNGANRTNNSGNAPTSFKSDDIGIVLNY